MASRKSFAIVAGNETGGCLQLKDHMRLVFCNSVAGFETDLEFCISSSGTRVYEPFLSPPVVRFGGGLVERAHDFFESRS